MSGPVNSALAQDFFVFMTKKIKIIAIFIILLLLGVWVGQNIYAGNLGRSAGAGQGKSSAENFRAESGDILPEQSTRQKTETKKASASGAPQSNPEVYPSATTASLTATVIAGEKTVILSVPAETTFYDALVASRDKGEIEFAGKNYPWLGFFVTDIGTLHAGGDLDLLYYINGKEASVGVSTYVLKDGDAIEWKLE